MTHLGGEHAAPGGQLEEPPDDGAVVGERVDNLSVRGVGVVGVVGHHLEHLGAGGGILKDDKIMDIRCYRRMSSPQVESNPPFAPSARGKAISPRGRFENPQASQAVRQSRQIFPEF